MREWRCVGTRVQAGPTEVRAGFATRRLLEFDVLVEAEDERGAAREFERATGVPAERIDGRAASGACDICGRPILAGEPCAGYGDGALICPGCVRADAMPAGRGVALG